MYGGRPRSEGIRKAQRGVSPETKMELLRGGTGNRSRRANSIRYYRVDRGLGLGHHFGWLGIFFRFGERSLVDFLQLRKNTLCE
jgi:hypothetical protein